MTEILSIFENRKYTIKDQNSKRGEHKGCTQIVVQTHDQNSKHQRTGKRKQKRTFSPIFDKFAARDKFAI